MSNSLSRAVAGLVLFALPAACNSPTAPGGTHAEPSGNRLEIASTSVVAPQQTADVQAFLVAPDGARQDVTARVAWTSSDSAVLSVSSSGRITGGAVGEATLRATFRGLSASSIVIVVPAGTFRLAGVVKAPGSMGSLAGVQVELVTGSGDVLTTTTGPAGFRFYGVAGGARLRIARRGFHPYEAEVDIRDHLTHDVSLSPIEVAGTYTLTLSASSRCRMELPEDARTRTYSADIAQQDASLSITLQGPAIYAGWNDRVTGWFGETNDITIEFTVPEVIDAAPTGRMTVTLVNGGLTGVLDGDMTADVVNEGGRGSRRVTCTAPDHGVVFSR